MDIYMQHEPPQPAVPLHHLTVRAAEGIDAVEVNFRLGENNDPTELVAVLRRIADVVEDRLTPEPTSFAELIERGRWTRG